MQDCTDKIVLITGASSGIGEACAIALAALGAKLILTARRSEKLQQLAAHLEKTYQAQVTIFSCDVTDPDDVQQNLAQLPPEFQAINVLINNAGLAVGLERLHEGNFDDWNRMIDTNIKGILHVTRYVLPGMLARKAGHIIQLGSTSAYQTYPGGGVYCATKHAVNALSKTLTQEVAGTPLRVTEIDPGMVDTEFSLVRFKGDKVRAQKVYEKMVPLIGADIADAIVYAITRPAHVNIAQMMLYAVDQPMAFRPN